MLRLLFIFTFTSAFLIAGAQEISRKPYKSSRKLVKEHICVECIDAGGLPGLPDIKNSKYEMEFRWLNRNHGGKETALAVTRQNNRYEAHLYFYNRVNSFDTVSKQWHIRSFKYKITTHDLDSVMNVLIQDGLFTLPDQSVTKTKFFRANEIHFKVNNEFKKYSFDHAPQYIQQYPDEDLYKKYDALLKDLYALTAEAHSLYEADMKIESKRFEKLAKKAKRMRKSAKGM
jgi:hypothetical protein